MTPGANRLAAMDFRFLPTVGMTGRGARNNQKALALRRLSLNQAGLGVKSRETGAKPGRHKEAA